MFTHLPTAARQRRFGAILNVKVSLGQVWRTDVGRVTSVSDSFPTVVLKDPLSLQIIVMTIFFCPRRRWRPTLGRGLH